MPSCTANNKPLCNNGVQQRYEAERGMVPVPCSMCDPENFEAWARLWNAAPKPEKPVVQAALFEASKQEAF